LKRIPYPADEQTVRWKGARIAARLKAADDTWQKERFDAGAAWGDHCPGRTRQALEAGHHVRALRGDGAPDPNLEKVRSDALKLRDAEAALTGVDVVIQTLGVGFGDLFRLVRLFSDATRVLIAAMKARASNV
jgi:hypothetical protein